MKHIKSLVLAVVILLAGVSIGACVNQPAASAPSTEQGLGTITVRVLATQDFGRELMLDEVLEAALDTSAMTALMEVAEVETAYGGGFVNAINGVRSGYAGSHKAKMDWFFYVNGIQSNVGALDYKLRNGDVQHWDFHDWSFRHFIPAIIDGFPSVFRNGFGGEVRPTLVVYQGNMEGLAEKLEKKLAQLAANDIGVRTTGELSDSEKESSNLLLVGLPDHSLISELNQNWQRLGFFVYFEKGNLVVLDTMGELAARFGAGTGLIQATQNPWNPKGIGACENVVWMVSGTDEAGVEEALEALLNHTGEFQYAGAVVVADGKIIRAPQ